MQTSISSSGRGAGLSGPPLCRAFLGALFACRRFLKYACHWGVYGNACCHDYADDVGEELVAV
jgi:hypothetical protein